MTLITFPAAQQEIFESAAIDAGFDTFECCPNPNQLGWILLPTDLSKAEHLFASLEPLSITEHALPEWQIYQGPEAPIEIGRTLLITPHHIDPSPTTRHIIRIDPGLSFGSGTHATTALMLELLENEPRGSMLDVGCGTGILSIAAQLLGHSPVVACDVDGEAAQLTRINAHRNHVQPHIFQGSIDAITSQFDVISANLLAITLTDLWPSLTRVTSRTLLVSGILEEQEQTFLGDIRSTPSETRRLDGWLAMRFTRSDFSQ